jgi:tRNA U34 5-carboxymethylaminomethyl modifying GTPase MnmE/TrmE
VDARDGLLPTDQSIIAKLRRNSKQIVLAVNKTDGLDENLSLSEFARLGVSAAVPMAASHNHGTQKLLDTVLPLLPAQDDEAQEALDDGVIRVAIIGRPNVGKSTLVNRLLGENRVIVSDGPAGTTRDSIRVPLLRDGRKYTAHRYRRRPAPFANGRGRGREVQRHQDAAGDWSRRMSWSCCWTRSEGVADQDAAFAWPGPRGRARRWSSPSTSGTA